jgi:hypothetical protein
MGLIDISLTIGVELYVPFLRLAVHVAHTGKIILTGFPSLMLKETDNSGYIGIDENIILECSVKG